MKAMTGDGGRRLKSLLRPKTATTAHAQLNNSDSIGDCKSHWVNGALEGGMATKHSPWMPFAIERPQGHNTNEHRFGMCGKAEFAWFAILKVF